MTQEGTQETSIPYTLRYTNRRHIYTIGNIIFSIFCNSYNCKYKCTNFGLPKLTSFLVLICCPTNFLDYLNRLEIALF